MIFIFYFCWIRLIRFPIYELPISAQITSSRPKILPQIPNWLPKLISKYTKTSYNIPKLIKNNTNCFSQPACHTQKHIPTHTYTNYAQLITHYSIMQSGPTMREPIQLIKKPRTIFISDGEWRHEVTGGVADGSEAVSRWMVTRWERDTSESQHCKAERRERHWEREGLTK